MQKVQLTKLLRSRLDLPLEGAKKITDDILEGKVVEIVIQDADRARSFEREIGALGVRAEIQH